MEQYPQVRQGEEFGQLDAGELHMRRTTADQQVHLVQRCGGDLGDHLARHIGVLEDLPVLQGDAGDVEGYVARTDDHDRAIARQVGGLSDIGMARIPGDEVGGTHAAGELLTGDPQLTVVPRPGGVHDRVVVLEQLLAGDGAADPHIAEEPHPRIVEGAGQGAGDTLGLGMVRGDAVAQQPIGGGQRFEDVDRGHLIAFEQCLHRIDPARPGSDDGHPPAAVRGRSIVRPGTFRIHH